MKVTLDQVYTLQSAVSSLYSDDRIGDTEYKELNELLEKEEKRLKKLEQKKKAEAQG